MTEDVARALRDGPYWQPLCEEIDKIVEGLRVKLDTADPKALTVIQLQERIRAFRRLKQLPEDVINRETA